MKFLKFETTKHDYVGMVHTIAIVVIVSNFQIMLPIDLQ
jgi:hypothetical protein